MKSGVYQIRNLVNGKCYIGSSHNMKGRWCCHKLMLEQNKHHCSHLQRSYNKHGKDNFVYEVLFTCPKEDLIRLEQYHIDHYNPEYNISKIAGSNLGLKRSDETRHNISKSLMGRKLSPEHIANVVKGTTGLIRSEEHRRNLSIINKGKILSAEHKQKLRDSHLGFKVKEETKEKLREFFKGRPNTWQSRKVQQICKDSLEVLQEFTSVKDASDNTGIGQGCISKTARGVQYIGRGYIWKYA